MAKYIIRGQMWRRHDGRRFYPGEQVEIAGKAPAGWEPVGDEAPAPEKPSAPAAPGPKPDPRIKR